jgi:hypothetical protein
MTTRAHSSLLLTEPLTKMEEEIGTINTTKRDMLGETIGKLSEGQRSESLKARMWGRV